MRFKLSPNAKKYIERQDNITVSRIYEALRDATKNPQKGDIKELQGEPGKYRLRVGGYRILFAIDGDNMVITEIGPRGQIYK